MADAAHAALSLASRAVQAELGIVFEAAMDTPTSADADERAEDAEVEQYHSAVAVGEQLSAGLSSDLTAAHYRDCLDSPTACTGVCMASLVPEPNCTTDDMAFAEVYALLDGLRVDEDVLVHHVPRLVLADGVRHLQGTRRVRWRVR